jgi:putative GTP pyrophosphokinase
LEVPIFLAEEKKNMKVEVQFRTIAMDFWASLEHKLKYKKDIQDSEVISRELKECAEASAALDLRMQSLRDRIEKEME